VQVAMATCGCDDQITFAAGVRLNFKLTTCTQKYSADRDFTYKVLTFEDQLLSHHTMKSSENYIILKKIS
jgi:hypothetical protein